MGRQAQPKRKAIRPPQNNDHRARSPTSIDFTIGKNLRVFRGLRGVSQETLAEDLGISFQQLQKYENGKNRISASRLFQAADILGVSILQFFDSASLSDGGSELLTAQNIELLNLIGGLSSERQEIAKNLIRALRI